MRVIQCPGYRPKINQISRKNLDTMSAAYMIAQNSASAVGIGKNLCGWPGAVPNEQTLCRSAAWASSSTESAAA
jgi:hypothetical protein